MGKESETLSGLIEGVAVRDVRAFKLLYDRTLPIMRAAVRRRIADASFADDILQLTYSKVWQNAARYDGARGRPLGWMLRICRNVMIDELRRARSIRENDQVAALSHGSRGESDDDLLIDLRKSLTALPPEQSNALAGIYVQGFSHAQLARELGIPLGTLKSRVRRAISALKDSMSGDSS